MKKEPTRDKLIDGVVKLAKIAVPNRANTLRGVMYMSELPFYYEGKIDLAEVTTDDVTTSAINEMRLTMADALGKIRDIRDRAIQDLSMQACAAELKEAHS